MTKREIETLKKGYQAKCTVAKVRREANPNSEAYAEAEVGFVYVED